MYPFIRKVIVQKPVFRPYERYAGIYDQTGQSRFSLRMASYARDLLGGEWPESVLDVACGTGAAAVAMALRGVRVSGLDSSPEMLKRARERSIYWGVDVDWIEADYRRFALPEGEGPDPHFPPSFAAATCFYDAVNYCHSIADLEALFRNVGACVVPGGAFIFDAITSYGIRHHWGNQVDAKVGEDMVRVWRASYDAKTGLGTLRITHIERQGGTEPEWARFDETHVHRGFDPVEVHAALQAAGWRISGTYQCMSVEPASAQTYRVAYFAKRGL